MKIPLRLIDPNPYQARESYDKEVAASIAVSALGRHGILQAPMVRPNNGRYETVFGHGRVLAAEIAGFKEIDCRVEDDITDEEMKKYVLQENLLRSDLSEKEKMDGLEQYRQELGLELGDVGFYSKLSQATGISEATILDQYFVKETRKLLENLDVKENISFTMVLRTRGLEPKDRVKLINKVSKKDWGIKTLLKIKAAIKNVTPEVRLKILDKETDLTSKTIEALSKIEGPANQLEAIDFILTRRLDEKTALQVIDDIIQGVHPIYEVQVTDEYKQTYQKFQKTYKTVNAWGYNHYQIVKDHWDQIDPILTGIEQKIQEFRRYHRG